MSKNLIEFAKHFVNSAIDADTFAASYMTMWKGERDAGLLTTDGEKVDEASSTIFSLADCYNPESDRDEYELDELQLREKIRNTLAEFNLQ
ncbi:colicin immunity protein [Pseudomonas fluorescens]|uniref:colicin immunity domain-containing protein n=1 Tax=Pseudomonas fluorescens TaxID=294 RepID=UPI001BD94EB3|nr:colicin immunity domain-containing protein [Pseudomonas fluorescens]MBT0624930.1 colicin immunity protein [Pseudomonas fluorescens]